MGLLALGRDLLSAFNGGKPVGLPDGLRTTEQCRDSGQLGGVCLSWLGDDSRVDKRDGGENTVCYL